MLQKKLSNTSNSTPNGVTKKTAWARKYFWAALAAFLLALALGIIAWFLWPRLPHTNVTINNVHITATVAGTPLARQRGLGGTSALAPNTGMLFVFNVDAPWSFWMKDMRYPLDIIWLSRDKQIVWMATNVQPTTYPNSFTPPTKARYVLEVPAGSVAAWQLQDGQMAQFDVP